MRLYVDCDDTLILWPLYEGTQVVSGADWKLNQPLIEAVTKFMQFNPSYDLVIWSGGGVDYARRWAEKCFPDKAWEIQPKLLRGMINAYILVGPNGDDICVDDSDIAPLCKTYKPQEFIDIVEGKMTFPMT